MKAHSDVCLHMISGIISTTTQSGLLLQPKYAKQFLSRLCHTWNGLLMAHQLDLMQPHFPKKQFCVSYNSETLRILKSII